MNVKSFTFQSMFYGKSNIDLYLHNAYCDGSTWLCHLVWKFMTLENNPITVDLNGVITQTFTFMDELILEIQLIAMVI